MGAVLAALDKECCLDAFQLGDCDAALLLGLTNHLVVKLGLLIPLAECLFLLRGHDAKHMSASCLAICPSKVIGNAWHTASDKLDVFGKLVGQALCYCSDNLAIALSSGTVIVLTTTNKKTRHLVHFLIIIKNMS